MAGTSTPASLAILTETILVGEGGIHDGQDVETMVGGNNKIKTIKLQVTKREDEDTDRQQQGNQGTGPAALIAKADDDAQVRVPVAAGQGRAWKVGGPDVGKKTAQASAEMAGDARGFFVRLGCPRWDATVRGKYLCKYILTWAPWVTIHSHPFP